MLKIFIRLPEVGIRKGVRLVPRNIRKAKWHYKSEKQGADKNGTITRFAEGQQQQPADGIEMQHVKPPKRCMNKTDDKQPKQFEPATHD